jgi:pimeloyl-ACP methyl ester carboxylesterase
MVALAVALDRQAQIDHLLLEDAAGFGSATPFASRLYFAISPERMARIVPRPIFNLAAGGSVPVDHASPAHKQALQDFLHTLTTFPGTRVSAIRAFDRIVGVWGAKYTLKDQVFKILTPTRALWGAQDNVVLLRRSEPAIKTMPRASVMTFPRAGHSPHFEQPQPFTQAVLDFLAQGAEAPVG